MMVKPSAKKQMNMANYNLTPGGNKANIVVGIISAIFLIAGITLIVVANFTELVSWLKTFGITLCVMCVPLIITIIYSVLNNKINKI